MNTINFPDAIGTWLDPLQALLDPGSCCEWHHLVALAHTLDDVAGMFQLEPELPAGAERSRRLLAIRAELSRRGVLDTTARSALFTVLAQFVCGYHDIDLRDAVGLGHGALIARHGGAAARERWVPHLLAGQLAGIAITEPHGGSTPAATRTTARKAADGTWLVTGRKTWISRLTEAAVLVVFFRAPDGTLAAAAVDATAPGLHRRPIPPSGLAGWSWGILDLNGVEVRPDDVLHGDGMTLLRNHFARYRPLVTATAIGGAAAVFDAVTAALAARQAAGDVTRLRDSALVTLGRTHAQLVTALLGAAAAGRLTEAGHPDAEWWAAVTKAHGIDLANQAAADLVLLLGAVGFCADSQVAKTRRDLNGLLYADGIHESLYRAAGKQHATRPSTAASVRALEPLLPRSA
ncbi:acyl-CoA dehydrogenase family protein [Nocardia pseudovaccinii]|uniref:acyl-CoA dehydrogenase family protein n=1 Tax=Nocardia pseudovaccinii TaxID=189540 RepID=UPI0007A54B89|nr:acyl-CoA dehydrogenase family protein [Nocardia pseudovaccinii]